MNLAIKMYNIIAYISLLVAWVISFFVCLDLFGVIEPSGSLAISIVVFTTLYYKINTKPITSVIENCWNKLSNKEKK